MSDWSTPGYQMLGNGGVIHTYSLNCGVGSSIYTGSITAAAWPATNKAIFVPFTIDTYVTAYQMAFIVGTQSGSYDIGLYDELGNRLVRTGTTVPVAGFAAADITDTTLGPGTYFMALNIDNTTATVIQISPDLQTQRVLGVQEQAVGALTLPDPATFANPSTTNQIVPQLAVYIRGATV